MILVVVIVVVIAALGAGWMALVAANGPRVVQQGDELVISNPGLAVSSAHVQVSIGSKSYSLTLATIPGGVTRVPLRRFDPALGAASGPASGASVTGKRLGLEFSYYSAIRLAGADEAQAPELSR